MRKALQWLPMLLACAGSVQGQTPAPDTITITADVVYLEKGGTALTFDMFRPRRPNGAAVIFLNSGGFESGRLRFLKREASGKPVYLSKNELMIVPDNILYPPLAQFSIDELLAGGFTVFDVRHGNAPRFLLDEMVADCRQALAYITAHASGFGVDPKRIGLFGASAGGYLATMVAASSPAVAATAVYYPGGYDWLEDKKAFPDVVNGLPALKLGDDRLGALSLKRHVAAIRSPFLIVYGENDFPFITDTCRNLAADLEKGPGVEVLRLAGTGHEFRTGKSYDAQHGETARLRMVAFFTRRLVR